MKDQQTVPQINLRAYFAAHAPAKPEAWFTPVFDEPRPKPRDGTKWCAGCTSGDPCMGNADCEQLQFVREAQEEWDVRRKKAECLQWRWAWADAMIEAMGEGKAERDASLAAAAIASLREIVTKSHLPGGWRRTGMGELVPVESMADCVVHPSLIVHARQVLANLDGGAA